MIDVNPTAEVIAKMANYLRESADRFDHIAKNMKENDDISYASEAMIEAMNIMQNMRLDLLVTRPIRELQREIERVDETR